MSFKKYSVILSCLCANFFINSSGYAAGYQIFPNLAYDNPANLGQIKQGQLIVGTTPPYLNVTFTGQDGPSFGRASSNTTNVLPYGRIAWRINPKIALGLDVTRPYYTNIQFPSNSILQFSAIDTIVYDIDYSPKLSYQVNEKLTVGAGINANFLYNGTISFAVPPFGTVYNRGDSWAYGWNAGLFYVINPLTFLNLSYFSEITHNSISGNSTWGPLTNNNLKMNVTLPGTLTANIIRMMTAKWALSATGRFIKWNQENDLSINNNALGVPVIIPLKYSNTWSLQLGTRYQLLDKMAIKAALQYDASPESTQYRPVGLPTYDLWVMAAGMEYAFTPLLSGQFLYAHGSSTPNINIMGPAGPTIGNTKVWGNFYDFSLTWNLA